jgi:hypothetical protein
MHGVGEPIDKDFLGASGVVNVYGLLEGFGATGVVHRGLLFV